MTPLLSQTAWDIGAKAIIALTESGRTAHLISKYRPSVSVLCVTPDEQVARQSLVYRSLYPVVLPAGSDITKIDSTLNYATAHGFAAAGELVVVTSGKISGNSGATNTMTIERVGKQ